MESEQFSLLDSLTLEWIKLPTAVMQDVGPAAQTLAGVLKVSMKETFSPVAEIAARARVPVATARKHLGALDQGGWIKLEGRQRTRGGHLRRTATIKITAQTRDHLEPYAVLPWWACCSIRRVGKMPWAARAVLSVVTARLMGIKAVIEKNNGDIVEADDVLDFLVNMEDERFEFSLDSLVQQTGLTRETVIVGKRWLYKVGIIEWYGRPPKRGENTPVDKLVPNWDFRVVMTSASAGRCYLDFHRGSENGQ